MLVLCYFVFVSAPKYGYILDIVLPTVLPTVLPKVLPKVLPTVGPKRDLLLLRSLVLGPPENVPLGTVHVWSPSLGSLWN